MTLSTSLPEIKGAPRRREIIRAKQRPAVCEPAIDRYEPRQVEIMAGREICPAREIHAPLAPLKSSAPHLDGKLSCIEALSEACRAAAHQILHNWAVVLESDDPEGLHQLRVGLRRLRSALKTFRPLIGEETLRRLDEQARNLGRVLSEPRDADVLATDIVDAVLADHEEDADLLSLKTFLAERRAGHRQNLRVQLTGEDWSAFRLQLAALPESVRSSVPERGPKGGKRRLKMAASQAIDKRWRRAAKAGRRLDKLTIEERHKLRKDLKTLRYTTELFSFLYPAKDMQRFSDKLRRLQDRFGYLNDLAVTEKLKSVALFGTMGTADLPRAVGYVIGWHTAHAEDAWRDIRKDWRRLARAPRFWSR